jgi:hypothetical protein
MHAAEARLERVEAAARELEDRAVTVWHQASVGTGIVKVEALNALNESLAVVAAALSDVTPPSGLDPVCSYCEIKLSEHEEITPHCEEVEE